jgi:hypothetical protein
MNKPSKVSQQHPRIQIPKKSQKTRRYEGYKEKDNLEVGSRAMK